MGTFMGGSAWAMAGQIGDGFILCSDRTWARMDRPDLEKLAFELDKLLRETRSQITVGEDTQAIQQKQRKLSRLTGALGMLRSYQSRMR
jgi:hypothetical protein